MSVEAITWAYKQNAPTSIYQKFTLVSLANYADMDGTCFPSIATLATNMSTSKSSVKAALGQLEDMGLITIRPRYGRTGITLRNKYILHLNEQQTRRVLAELDEEDREEKESNRN